MPGHNSLTDDQRDMLYGKLQAAVAELGQHFDAVQIFCMKDEGVDGSTTFQEATGNSFTRYGQVKAFVIGMEEEWRKI